MKASILLTALIIMLNANSAHTDEWVAKFYTDGNCKEVVGFAARRVLTLTKSSMGKANGYMDLSKITWDGENNITSPNNEISCARVAAGYRARLFTDKNYHGQQLRLDKDPQYGRANFIPEGDGFMKFSYFPASSKFDFNDETSSLYIEPY